MTNARAIVVAIAAIAVAGCGGSPHWSVPLPALDRVPLSVAQPAPHQAWVVGGALGSGGNALVLHYDGSSWQRTDPGTDATLWWVSASDPPWMVGERGTVLVGLAPETVPTTATLYGVWVSPSGVAWIVGGDPDLSGVILRGSAGGSWQDLTPAGTSAAFFKVWGSGDDDVWICGQNGALLHWNGSALAAVTTGVTRDPLFTVAGRDASDIYAVGGTGSAIVLHHDASGWTRLSDPLLATTPGLSGVSVDSDGIVALVGAGGAKLRGKPGAFVDETEEATRADLHAVSLVGGEIYVVGGNYQAQPGTPRQGVVAHFGGAVSSTVN